MSDMDRQFWNDAFKEDPNQVMVADHVLDRELASLTPGAALDLGCGSGANALRLAAKGWSVVGVDWAEHAIELATQAAEERGLDATFLVADITIWQPSAKFDLVISTYALPGGEDSRQALQTASKALAPGGTLLVAEWDKSMSRLWNFAEDDLLSPGQIVELLPGLEIEKAEVRHLEDIFASDELRAHENTSANAAFVRARKPQDERIA